jgi:hypothetical protein
LAKGVFVIVVLLKMCYTIDTLYLHYFFMREPHYRQALSFAWRHTIKHPFLWIYGMFAAILGQMGVFDFLTHAYLGVTQGVEIGALFSLRKGLFFGILNSRHLILPSSWVWLLWLVVCALGVAAFFIMTAVVSQGALIHASAKSIMHPESFKADTRAWHAGVSHFWRLFFLQAVQKGLIGLLILLVGGGALSALVIGSPASRVLFLVLFLFSVFLGVIVSFLTQYTAGYIVVEDYPLGDALHAGYRLFREHWLVSLEFGALLAIANVGLALAVVVGFFLLLVPVVLFWFIATVTSASGLFVAGFGFMVLVFVAFLLLLSATFTVFSTTTWTYLFMKMHREGVPSRFLRWLKV